MTRAIILAAGVGKRLAAITKDRPKSLIEIGGKTLLARSLEALSRAGAARAVVVIGYRADMVRAELARHPAPLPVETIVNPRFTEGAILSLHAAREHLDDDVVVMDADVLYHPSIMADLLGCPAPSAFLCDTDHEFTGEEMMLHGTLGRVTRIHRGVLPGERVLGEAVGFLKLGREHARALRALLDAAVAAGRTGIEHEELYDDLLRDVPVAAVSIASRPWIEIDFEDDVRRARDEVLPLISAPAAP